MHSAVPSDSGLGISKQDIVVRVFVTDNPCVPNPTIDASVWPSDKRSTTLAVLFGETQTLQLTGVSNG